MQKRIYLPIVFTFLALSISCTKKVIEVHYAPVLYNASAPDSLQKGSFDTSYVYISVFDPDGPGDIDSVYFIATRPDGTTNAIHLYMHDDGLYGDPMAGDGQYSLGIQAPLPSSQSGDYTFTFYAMDRQGDKSNNPQVIVTAY